MTKKILILSSSPRRGGNSDTLCDELTRQSIIAQDAAHVACTENLARRKTMRQKL